MYRSPFILPDHAQSGVAWRPSRGSASLTVIVVHIVVNAPPTRRQHYRAAIDCLRPSSTTCCAPTAHRLHCLQRATVSWCSTLQRPQHSMLPAPSALPPAQPAVAATGRLTGSATRIQRGHVGTCSHRSPLRRRPHGARRLRSRGCLHGCSRSHWLAVRTLHASGCSDCRQSLQAPLTGAVCSPCGQSHASRQAAVYPRVDWLRS